MRVWLWLSLVAVCLANNLFVNSDTGNDGTSCDSSTAPCRTLERAFAVANSGGESALCSRGALECLTAASRHDSVPRILFPDFSHSQQERDRHRLPSWVAISADVQRHRDSAVSDRFGLFCFAFCGRVTVPWLRSACAFCPLLESHRQGVRLFK